MYHYTRRALVQEHSNKMNRDTDAGLRKAILSKLKKRKHRRSLY